MTTMDFRVLPEDISEAVLNTKPGANPKYTVSLGLSDILHARLSLAATVFSQAGEVVTQQDLVRAGLDLMLARLGITNEYAFNNSTNRDLPVDSERAQLIAASMTPEQHRDVMLRVRELPRLKVPKGERLTLHPYVTTDAQTYLSVTNYLKGMDELDRPSINEVLRQGLELVSNDLGITLPYRNQLRNMRWLSALFGRTMTDWGRLAFYYYCSEHGL